MAYLQQQRVVVGSRLQGSADVVAQERQVRVSRRPVRSPLRVWWPTLPMPPISKWLRPAAWSPTRR